MRSSTPHDNSGHCARCLFRLECCICADVMPTTTRTRVVFVRHAIERWKTSGTVRWARLVLPQSELLIWGDPVVPWTPERLPVDDAWVLFPSESGRPTGPAPQTLVVLDGSWQQSRRMLQRIPEVQTLPRFGLPPPPTRTRLRRPTVIGGMSSLEALASALEILGEPGPARALIGAHDLAVKRALALKGLKPLETPEG